MDSFLDQAVLSKQEVASAPHISRRLAHSFVLLLKTGQPCVQEDCLINTGSSMEGWLVISHGGKLYTIPLSPSNTLRIAC